MVYKNYTDVPMNTPVWGFHYSTNYSEKSMGLKKQPVLGELRLTARNSYHDYTYFFEYKKNGDIKESSKVYGNSRKYADTYEEAVVEYNKLVNNQINKLEKLIDSTKLDLLKEV